MTSQQEEATLAQFCRGLHELWRLGASSGATSAIAENGATLAHFTKFKAVADTESLLAAHIILQKIQRGFVAALAIPADETSRVTLLGAAFRSNWQSINADRQETRMEDLSQLTVHDAVEFFDQLLDESASTPTLAQDCVKSIGRQLPVDVNRVIEKLFMEEFLTAATEAYKKACGIDILLSRQRGGGRGGAGGGGVQLRRPSPQAGEKRYAPDVAVVSSAVTEALPTKAPRVHKPTATGGASLSAKPTPVASPLLSPPVTITPTPPTPTTAPTTTTTTTVEDPKALKQLYQDLFKYSEDLIPILTTIGDKTIPAPPVDPEHPQRVSNATVGKIVTRMCKGEGGATKRFICDTKYDGERLLVHKNADDGGNFGFHSRNRLVVPERKLGGVRERLREALVPERKLADFRLPKTTAVSAKILKCESVVLDCEILSDHTFGSQNKVSKLEIKEHGARIYPFDIMYYNGHDVSRLSLLKRRVLLHAVIKHVPKKVEHIETREIILDAGTAAGGGLSMEHQLQKAFDDTIRHGIEGLVVKPVNSTYVFGGTDWVKVKKGYIPTDASKDLSLIAAARGGDVGGGAEAVADAYGEEADGLKTGKRPKEAGMVISSPLKDTLDCLVVGVTKGRDKLILAVSEKKGSFVTCGLVPIPAGFTVPNWGKLVAVDTLASTDLPCDDFLKIKKRCSEVPIGKVFTTSAVCPVVEVTATLLIEDRNHTCHSLAVGPDAKIVRLREDKSDWCTTRAQQVLSLFSEGKVRPRALKK